MFGCISKYFSKNIFWCLEKKLKKKKEEAKPRKTRTYLEEHGTISRSTARSRITISANGASRDRDLDGVISRSVDRERCFARDRAARSRVLSLSRSPFARALFARPQFRKSFEVKIGMEMNFRGQHCYFTVN